MSTSNGYELIQEDVEVVLMEYELRRLDDMPIVSIAARALSEIDTERVCSIAAAANGDDHAQDQAVFDEIKQQLVELGYLEF